MRERAGWQLGAFVVLVALALSASASSRVVLDHAELFMSSRESPDLDACTIDRSPLGNATRALVAMPNSFVWLFAGVSQGDASAAITIQVVDDDEGVVYAWKRHVFAANARCLVGSFAAVPLLEKFGPDRQLLAQIIVGDSDVRVSMPFRLSPGPPRSLLIVVPAADAIDCNFGVGEPFASAVHDASLIVLCVELAPSDAGKPITFEFASPAGVVSMYNGDSSHGRPVLFMPIGAKQLRNVNSLNGTFSASFDVGGERRLTRQFSLIASKPAAAGNTTNPTELLFCPHGGACTAKGPVPAVAT